MIRRVVWIGLVIIVTSVITYFLLSTRQAAIETVSKSYQDWEIQRATFNGEWTVTISKKQKTYKIIVNTTGTQIIGEPGCACED
jgi:intein-encoded DNA endonuclease-like protein